MFFLRTKYILLIFIVQDLGTNIYLFYLQMG